MVFASIFLGEFTGYEHIYIVRSIVLQGNSCVFCPKFMYKLRLLTQIDGKLGSKKHWEVVMFQDAQIKLKCWFHNLAHRPNYRRYANIDMGIEQALKSNTPSSHWLLIDGVKTEKVTGHAVEDVSKYTLKTRSVYIKHVFINDIKNQVKPTISAVDIDFFEL